MISTRAIHYFHGTSLFFSFAWALNTALLVPISAIITGTAICLLHFHYKDGLFPLSPLPGLDVLIALILCLISFTTGSKRDILAPKIQHTTINRLAPTFEGLTGQSDLLVSFLRNFLKNEHDTLAGSDPVLTVSFDTI